MRTTHFCLDAYFVTHALVEWHRTARIGDIASITVPFQVRTVRLVCSNNNLLYWWPEGERGATLPFQDALQRLRMLHEMKKAKVQVTESYRTFAAF